MKSAKNVVPFGRPGERRNKEELAFLPAALEIVETPPSPIGRAIAILIAILFCVVLAWAYFGKIDIIASAPGKVFTHETLMSRVWGAEYVDARHYLYLYIRYLREKLEDDPTRPKLIRSEWGVGYRLEAPDAALVATI